MAFIVKFNLLDEFSRKITRSYVNTGATIAAVLADVVTLGPLLDAVTEGGMTGVSISQKSTATTFSSSSPSNVDENASIKVLAGDGFVYDFDLPMPIAALRLPGGAIDLTNAALILFFAEFLVGDNWRINLRNPTDIVTLESGKLDK